MGVFRHGPLNLSNYSTKNIRVYIAIFEERNVQAYRPHGGPFCPSCTTTCCMILCGVARRLFKQTAPSPSTLVFISLANCNFLVQNFKFYFSIKCFLATTSFITFLFSFLNLRWFHNQKGNIGKKRRLMLGNLLLVLVKEYYILRILQDSRRQQKRR